MKKKLIALLSIMLLNISLTSYANNMSAVPLKAAKSFMQTGNENVVRDVRNTVYLHTKYSNEFKLDKLQNMYTSDYINADGFGKEKLFLLINDTWKGYPDIKYAVQIKDVRIGPKYVVVQTSEKAIATTSKKSEVTNDFGELYSVSDNLLYLKKVDGQWKIFAEKLISEKTSLKYGCAKKVPMALSVPQLVKAGDDYTISLKVNKTPESVVVASINADPIVYPESQSKEIFRQLNSKGVLERVVQANSNNRNEMAVASIGFTEQFFDIYQKPRLKMTGLALVMQRVNVNGDKSFVPDDLSKR